MCPPGLRPVWGAPCVVARCRLRGRPAVCGRRGSRRRTPCTPDTILIFSKTHGEFLRLLFYRPTAHQPEAHNTALGIHGCRRSNMACHLASK